MKFGPKRGHVMFIFERFFRDFGLLLAAGVLYLILRDSQILWQNSGLLAVVLIAPVSRLIQYLTTWYIVDETRLLVRTGWLNKKEKEVPLANITTVDFTQTFLFQLTNVCAVHVDTAGSIGGDAAQLKMVLKKKDAVYVKKLLLVKQNREEIREEEISEDTSGNTIMASLGEILLMGLLRSKAAIVIQLLTYAGVGVSIFSKIFMERTVDGEDVMVEYLLSMSAPLLIIAAVLGLYLVGVAVSIALSAVRYYGFRVTNRDNSIFVEYGLFTRKTHTLMKDKISGVSFNQSLFMRFFGRGTLEVFAAGYGNGQIENNELEIAVLYPVLRKAKLYDFLERFLPEVKSREPLVKARRKDALYFFLCRRFFFACLFFAACVLVPIDYPLVEWGLLAAGIFSLLLAAGSVLLESVNTAFSANKEVMLLTCGGYTKNTILLKTDKVETIEETASQRKRGKRGITNIYLGVLAPGGAARHKVRNLSLEVFENAREKLLY